MKRLEHIAIACTLLFVVGTMRAGQISVACNLGQLSQGFASHGYAQYTSIFGNQTAEAVSVQDFITKSYVVEG